MYDDDDDAAVGDWVEHDAMDVEATAGWRSEAMPPVAQQPPPPSLAAAEELARMLSHEAAAFEAAQALAAMDATAKGSTQAKTSKAQPPPTQVQAGSVWPIVKG